MPTVTEVERAIDGLTPRQLHVLRRRLAEQGEALADVIAHRAALLEGDFKPWTEVKRELHALHSPRRPVRAKIS